MASSPGNTGEREEEVHRRRRGRDPGMTRSNQRRPNLSGAGARWRPGRRYWRARPRRRNADRPRWPATFPRNSPADTWTPANSSRTGLFTTAPGNTSESTVRETPDSWVSDPKGIDDPRSRQEGPPNHRDPRLSAPGQVSCGSDQARSWAGRWRPRPNGLLREFGPTTAAIGCAPGPDPGAGLGSVPLDRPSRRRPADGIGTQAARTADVSIRLGLGAPASGAGCPRPPAANPDCFVTGDSPIWGNHPLTWRGDGQGTAIS